MEGIAETHSTAPPVSMAHSLVLGSPPLPLSKPPPTVGFYHGRFFSQVFLSWKLTSLFGLHVQQASAVPTQLLESSADKGKGYILLSFLALASLGNSVCFAQIAQMSRSIAPEMSIQKLDG